MSLDPAASNAANAAVWAAHPGLAGRQLTTDPADAPLRQEWRNAYNAELAKKPPPPVVVPVAVVPPPPLIGPVMACGAVPPSVTVTNCKDIAAHVQEGDIVVRGQSGDDESEFISTVSGCNYSHAGIVARDASGKLVVVDAYPARGPSKDYTHAVAANPVDDFFCKHNATQGMVTRPKDCGKAQKAARWAVTQTADPSYKFNLWDPWNNDPKQVYCSDFVHQSFENGGTELVPFKADFLDAAHYANTMKAVRTMKPIVTKPLRDANIETKLRNKTGGSSEYITPCQVAVNAETQTIVNYVYSPPAKPSLGSKLFGP